MVVRKFEEEKSFIHRESETRFRIDKVRAWTG
jgi:hypothetical protein